MTDPADYIPVIQVLKILVLKVPALIFILFFYAIFYIAILGGTRKQNEVCPYCGRLLKISDGNTKFVSA